MKRVITYGTFDMLHYGHINLLRRAKELGGNVDNLVANKLGDDDDVKKSKFKYVFRRVFPDYKSFKKYHPLICRYKVLVPFGYLFRIIKLPFTGWKRAMAELKAVLRK